MGRYACISHIHDVIRLALGNHQPLVHALKRIVLAIRVHDHLHAPEAAHAQGRQHMQLVQLDSRLHRRTVRLATKLDELAQEGAVYDYSRHAAV